MPCMSLASSIFVCAKHIHPSLVRSGQAVLYLNCCSTHACVSKWSVTVYMYDVFLAYFMLHLICVCACVCMCVCVCACHTIIVSVFGVLVMPLYWMVKSVGRNLVSCDVAVLCVRVWCGVVCEYVCVVGYVCVQEFQYKHPKD